MILIYFVTYLTSNGNLLKVISAVVGNPVSIIWPTSFNFPYKRKPIPISPYADTPP